ncbi:SCL-interrupting locus protein [Aquarana catesbeiana]|uniref:SCL-interrupting locus protein n=1 Tax=Aquarana catesbeiana TaxID=8400 RepID=UPI003CC9C44D
MDMSTKMSLQQHKEARPVSSDNQINIRNMSNRMLPIHFPPTKTVLWDSTPMGEPIGLHFSYYRNLHLLLSEKALRLAYRHAKTERRVFSCLLLGSFFVDDDEEGVTLTIDRFDPGREKAGIVGKVPSALLPGDFVIPCSVSTRESAGNVTLHTPEDFAISFKGLQSHLHCKEALDLSKLLTVRAHITYSENMDNLHFDLRWAAVTVANSFESTPIKPVPIIPTALARNLSSHNNIAQLQGTHKCGYLTMDQTRKLLLVLESDPKAYTLPLVGIWLSGITHIHSPQVWASCLRYLFSSSIKERVLSESGSFLIVLYSLTHKEPEFYECIPCIGHDPLGYQLLTCEESLHLFKNVESSKPSPLSFELATESQNSEAYLLNEVSKTVSVAVNKQHASPTKLSVSDHDSGVEDEDFSPRPSPHPHPSFQQATRIHPSVPELSLVFGSVVEPKLSEIGNKKIPPFSSTPNVADNQFTTSYPHDLYRKECVPKPVPVPFKASKTTRLSRGKSSTTDKAHFHSNGQTRRNSTASSTSSSSLSTPQTGSSPDTSVHQVKGSSELDLRCGISGPCQEQPPLTSSPYSRRSSLPHSPNHNATFPLQTKPLSEAQKPSQNFATCRHQTNICSGCVGISPVQCHSPTSWPAVSHISHRGLESPSEPPGNVMPFYQNMPCPNACCSPLLMNCGRTVGCATPVDGANSPVRRDSLPVNSCSSNSCMVMSPPTIPGPSGMLGLSAEAYQLLAEQDKQLKLLQTQIQRLLEAQAARVDSRPSRSEKTAESVATETERSEPVRKTSVSIAVGTGASLFWNPPPCPEEEESLNKQDESELCNELTAAVNNEQDASNTTISSSLKAVDIYSFAESSQLTDSADHSPPALPRVGNARSEPLSHLLHDGRLSATASGYDASQEHHGNQKDLDHEFSVPSLPQEKLYQDLLNQVNNFLKTSSSASEESCENISRVSSRASGSVSEKPRECRPSEPSRSDQHSVQRATLKQLKSLGVEMSTEPSDVKLNSGGTADNACVLACINPDAVIPRLNYLSFTNIGLSCIVPNGVDLSMEANAIALKYLSESQLTQLSLSHTNQNKDVDSSSFHGLFSGNSEKSMVGLSLISPNMSFATKKYLKRYALIESNDSSDEELDLPSEAGHLAMVQSNKNQVFPNSPDNKQILNSNSEPKTTPRATDNTTVEFVYHPEGNKLRNITNEMPKKAFPTVQTSDGAPLHFLKDINPRSKLTSGKALFNGHHDKENGRNTPLMNTEDSNSSGRKLACPQGSLEEILDVNHLRQLPKLF